MRNRTKIVLILVVIATWFFGYSIGNRKPRRRSLFQKNPRHVDIWNPSYEIISKLDEIKQQLRQPSYEVTNKLENIEQQLEAIELQQEIESVHRDY